jgi:ABC-type bacteriocin/lantibiotic exporter with double-glycine peptidase domain
VPFYRQASQFTCGPASLMMVMKFFRPTIQLNRELELDIWRESNLVESYGTSKEGLALAAARRGFSVYTMGPPHRHSFVDAIRHKIPTIDSEILELLYKDIRKKFRAMGLKNANQKIELTMMQRILQKSHVPLVLTSTSLFGDKEALPHWIVLTGHSNANWYVNNPLAKSPNTRIDGTKLKKNLSYRGIQCAVIIRGSRNRKKSFTLLENHSLRSSTRNIESPSRMLRNRLARQWPADKLSQYEN